MASVSLRQCGVVAGGVDCGEEAGRGLFSLGGIATPG